MFSVITLSNHEPGTRRSHKKSKGGCLACKARRLKCDELRPICGNCERYFGGMRVCEYGIQKTPTPPRKLSKKRDGKFFERDVATVSEKEASEKSASTSIALLPLSLSKAVSAGMLDPFQTHPPTLVKGMDHLMKHYLKEAVYDAFPWQPPSDTNPTTTYFVPLVWSDEVLFHATLVLTYQRSRAQRKQILTSKMAGLQLLSETTRLLRQRVESENRDEGVAVSDQTISAVAALAASEHEKGNLAMLKMHMDGLRRMVELRGGLNSIRETNPMVANSVFWMFVVAMYAVPFPALDTLLQPFFPGDHGLTSPFVSSHFEDIAPGTSDPPSLKYMATGLIQPVASVLISVQHVSQLVPTHKAYSSASISLVILTRLCTLLSHLLSLRPIRSFLPYHECEATEFSASISECARLALLLHVFTPWCGLPPDGSLTVNCLLQKLVEASKRLFASPLMKKNVLALWIFSVGGVAAAGKPERQWFLLHLKALTLAMAIKSWDDMRGVLRQGVWHEQLCERPHRSLWEEMVSFEKMPEPA